ncbi:MAG TPA: DUF1499 domain-containing protein [Burkholderiales bacterium]|nr:DUF1499 domain-containing protein [Burkholderiales bacterium]
MWWPRIALLLSILAAALLVFSGLGVRAGLWPFRVGFGMFAGAMLSGLAAIGAASIALAVPRLRHPKRILIAALALGAASAAMPLEHLRRVKTLPYINDITTDTEKPPQFLEPKIYQSHFAELQRIGYPGLQPLQLAVPPAQAFARALAAARAMELEIVAADEKAGRIEAVATTRWFGFKDDMAVRVSPSGAGSRIDVRSKSRVGRSDVGANARRIQEFLTRVGGERGATYHPRGNDDRLQAHAARGLPARRAGAGL